MPLSSTMISEVGGSIGCSGMEISTLVALASQPLATSSPITGGSVEYICRPRCLMVPMSNSIRYFGFGEHRFRHIRVPSKESI